MSLMRSHGAIEKTSAGNFDFSYHQIRDRWIRVDGTEYDKVELDTTYCEHATKHALTGRLTDRGLEAGALQTSLHNKQQRHH